MPYRAASFFAFALIIVYLYAPGPVAWTQADQSEPEAPIEAVFDENGDAAGMTLFDLLQTGGWVMAVLAALSVLTLTLALYYFAAMTEKKLAPPDLAGQIRNYARDQKVEELAKLCKRSPSLLARVVLAGASRAGSDPSAVSSAMEAAGRREAETWMRRVRYLSDIATVAPMLGLLGTVLGMIQAFNFIAFDISAVKPVALASAVAQALVTTAAGLIVAIPSMGLFFFFRGRLEAYVARVEELAVETGELISQPKKTVRKTVRKPAAPRRGE